MIKISEKNAKGLKMAKKCQAVAFFLYINAHIKAFLQKYGLLPPFEPTDPPAYY